MPKSVQVISVGPAMSVPGGISRVVELIRTHLPSHIVFRPIATFTRYTGYKGTEGAEPGNRIAQVLVYFAAVAQVTGFAFSRRTIFHVHFAGRGSILRKGMICLLLRTFRCQYVVQSHVAESTLFHEWLPVTFQNLLLWGLKGAENVIVLTGFWRDYYSALLDVPDNKILVLPNPADLPKYIPDRAYRKNIKLLFLGRVGKRKGAFDIIRALASLPEEVRSCCHLTMAGDGEIAAAHRLSEALGCSKHVSMTGWVGPAEVERLLRDSDVLLLPSYAEGMAMALIEAMSWGLPVIASDAGGASEFLDQGHNCILVEPGDVVGISAAIRDLAQDATLRRKLGNAARQTISRFSIDGHIEILSELYESMASKLTGDEMPRNLRPTYDGLDKLSGGVGSMQDASSVAMLEPAIEK